MRWRGRDAVAPLAAAVLAIAAVAGMADEKPAPSVKVETGALAGSVEGGVESWKGIPFAAPPIGPLRWRAPQPAASWSGVRQATAYGHDCMQKPFTSDAAPLGAEPAEDCLYANVWRPAGAAAKLPVLVWVYGGGFVNGGSSPPVYSGANLARQGILVADIGGRTGYMVMGARDTATTIAAAGVPVYAYRFSYVAESSERREGAPHASDIPFFFETVDVRYEGKTTPRDIGMSKAIRAYLVNFAKSGDPNGGGLPVWPRYSRAADVIANFAEDGTMVPQKDPWGPELDAAAQSTR